MAKRRRSLDPEFRKASPHTGSMQARLRGEWLGSQAARKLRDDPGVYLVDEASDYEERAKKVCEFLKQTLATQFLHKRGSVAGYDIQKIQEAAPFPPPTDLVSVEQERRGFEWGVEREFRCLCDPLGDRTDLAGLRRRSRKRGR